MEPNPSEIVHEFGPFFRAYKDGRVERFFGTDTVPPSINSKDVLISPETGVSARIFIPTAAEHRGKRPLLVYFHGGGFIIGSPFCATYHNYITSLVAESNVVAVSVHYRLAPEYPVPIAYEDSWAALKWVAGHRHGNGHEAWLNHHADFHRLFLAGDSAGANIAHNMAVQAGIEEEELNGVKPLGVCLIHPYFGRTEPAGAGGGVDKSWRFVCPTTCGFDDPRINPTVDSRLPRLGCRRVLVCVAEKDMLKERGVFYCETLRKCEGWGGEVEIVETEGEGHVFHLFNPDCGKAVELLKMLACFMNQGKVSSNI